MSQLIGLDLVDPGELSVEQMKQILVIARERFDTIEPEIEGFIDKDSDVKGKVIIKAGAQVRNSRIRGPVVICRGAQVECSFVGSYTYIGKNSRVIDAEIADSIVCDGASVIGLNNGRVEGSVIGPNAKVTRRTNMPRAHRLFLKGESEVEIF